MRKAPEHDMSVEPKESVERKKHTGVQYGTDKGAGSLEGTRTPACSCEITAATRSRALGIFRTWTPKVG